MQHRFNKIKQFGNLAHYNQILPQNAVDPMMFTRCSKKADILLFLNKMAQILRQTVVTEAFGF